MLDAVLERITYANEETGYSSSFDLVSHAPPGPGTAKITGEGARGGDLLTAPEGTRQGRAHAARDHHQHRAHEGENSKPCDP